MGRASASADGLVYRGASAPRRFPLLLAACAAALAAAAYTTYFGPVASGAGAATSKDASSDFDDRFSRSAEPISIDLSPRVLVRSLPADVEAKLQLAKTLLALKLREGTERIELSEKPSAEPTAVAVPLPRPRPAEALALQNSEAPRAGSDRSLLQKLSDLLPARITLASLTPDAGPDLPSLGFDNFTAVYDISAQAVYLPNGSKLEAHSGLGNLKDDPAHVNERNVGATPPAVYDLKPREQTFHGIEALRMIPVQGNATFGRAGLLAHSYMLGSAGDSNGCVSIKEYDKFLAAFRKGEIKRLVVVTSVIEASQRPMSKS
jgi:hypothetical protein